MTKIFAAACAAAVLTLTTACGGGGDRPSADEVSASLQKEDSLFGEAVPAETADCMAKALESSNLSDESLQALVDADEDYNGNDEEEAILNELTDDITECTS